MGMWKNAMRKVREEFAKAIAARALEETMKNPGQVWEAFGVALGEFANGDLDTKEYAKQYERIKTQNELGELG